MSQYDLTCDSVERSRNASVSPFHALLGGAAILLGGLLQCLCGLVLLLKPRRLQELQQGLKMVDTGPGLLCEYFQMVDTSPALLC